MNMKALLIGAAAVALSGAAYADTLNLAQFLPAMSNFSSPLGGVTSGGVDYTITDTYGFTSFNQSPNLYGGPWFGTFAVNAPVLWNATYDGEGPGDITVTFDTPITSLSEYVNSNYYGDFTATITAYDNGVEVANGTGSGLMNGIPNNAPLITVSALAITSIEIGTSNDGGGFAISDGVSGAVPEVSTWAMMGLGFFGLAFAGYRSRRSATAMA